VRRSAHDVRVHLRGCGWQRGVDGARRRRRVHWRRIAPKILPRLRDGTFLDAFAHKGRFSAAMRRIPVQIVLAPNVALIGAAEHARELRD